MSDADDVISAISGKRYRYRTEVELHAGLASALTEAGIGFEREVRIEGGRIDFVVGDVGVEVKIKGSATAVRQQIERYADSDLTEFLVVTTRPAHRAASGATTNGKRVRVLSIGAF